MMRLLYRYVVVGGLPDAVNTFLETKHLGKVAEVFKSIIAEYEDDYHVKHAIKFGNYNIGREGPLLTLPHYMGFLLDFESDDDIVLDDLDIEEMNRIVLH